MGTATAIVAVLAVIGIIKYLFWGGPPDKPSKPPVWTRVRYISEAEIGGHWYMTRPLTLEEMSQFPWAADQVEKNGKWYIPGVCRCGALGWGEHDGPE